MHRGTSYLKRRSRRGKGGSVLIRKAGEIMTREVVTVSGDSPVSEALRLMASKNLSSLVVMVDGLPAGLINEAAILEVAATDADLNKIPAGGLAEPFKVTLGPDDSSLDAVLLFERSGVRTAVALNPDGTLAGVLSVTDILRHLKDDSFITQQRVKHSMSKVAALVGEMTGVGECLRKMAAEKSDSVIVTARGEGIGIFTRRDAIKLLAKKAAGESGALLDPVYKHMTSPLVTVNGESSLHDACLLLEKMRIRRLVVVDSRNSPRGVLLQNDLLRRLDANYSEILRRAVNEASIRLSADERKYRALVEASSEAIFLMVDDRFSYANRPAGLLFGRGESGLAGAPIWEVVHPDDADMVRVELDERAEEPGPHPPFRFRAVKKGGGELIVEATARLVPDSNEMAFAGTFRDVSADVHRMREMSRHATAMSVLHSVSMAFTPEISVDDCVKNACAAIVKGGEFVSCSFLACHGEECVIEGMARAEGGTVTASSPKLHLGLADCPGVREALANNEPSVARVDGPGSTAAKRLFFGKMGTSSIIAVPMSAEGRMIGVLALGFGRPTPPADPEDMQYYATLAKQMATAHEKIRLNRMLHDSEAQYRELFNSAVDVVLKVGLTGIIEDVNPQFTIVTGYGSTEWVGRRFSELAECPDGNDRSHAAVERFSGMEALLKTHYGPKYFYVSSWPRYSGRGVMIGNWKVARDVSEQKERERELIRLKEKAEAANRAKSAFLANISHEFRTPLTAIIGFGNLISENRNVPPEIMNQGKIVVTQGKNLLELINNVLNYVDAEKGAGGAPALAPVRLSSLLAVCAEKEAGTARDRGVTVSVKTSDGLSDVVMADERRLTGALNQLVNNAVKFTQNGLVTIAAGLEGGNMVFTVSDTGIGIEVEEMAGIFDSFAQVDGSITRRYGGVGLGLALAKSLISQMGGALSVSSKPGEGSSFRFTVPHTPVKDEAPSRAAVLFADDDEATRVLVAEVLSRAGYRATVVKNGLDAVEACRNSKFDLLILDLVMPGMNGIEAARETRRLRGYGDVPIIALTGYRAEGHEDHVLHSGFDVFLAKPFRPLDLLDKIERELQKTQASESRTNRRK